APLLSERTRHRVVIGLLGRAKLCNSGNWGRPYVAAGSTPIVAQLSSCGHIGPPDANTRLQLLFKVMSFHASLLRSPDQLAAEQPVDGGRVDGDHRQHDHCTPEQEGQ